MTKEQYRKKAELYAGLLVLAITDGDFSRVYTYLEEIKKAIEAMRKTQS